ncbi:DUF6461 domain-containing protein [Streptomyces sp. NPDC059161]|uniref:DUF6461 domain-containing protein n=1 Tax=unclassified Streptomyces TaxID=2593676 RepID=UPI00364F26C1
MTGDGMQWIPGVFDTYCLAFARGITVSELVRRMGADIAAVRHGVTGGDAFSLAMGEGPVALLGTSEGWAFSLEHWSDQAADNAVLGRLSTGTQAVVLLNGGTGPLKLACADNGSVVADFEPGVAAADIGTSAADHLVAIAREAGLFETDGGPALGEGDEELWMLRFAEEVFRLTLPRDEVEHGTLDAVLLP